jgi:hypothetical protein
MNTQGSSSAKPFGGYGFAIRTFWVVGSDLIVARRWKKDDTAEKSSADHLRGLIRGRAISRHDSVGIIGKDNPVKEFSLYVKNDDKIIEEWESVRQLYELELPHNSSTPEMRIRSHIFDELNKNPPSATLFFVEADWELGIDAGWTLECAIPSHVFVQLEAELAAGRATEVVFGIRWEGGLVYDEHAPPGYPTSWGLMCVANGKSPEPLRGHVEHIHWNLQDGNVGAATTEVNANEQSDFIKDARTLLEKTVGVMATNNRNLSYTISYGFACVFLLVAILALSTCLVR